MLKTNFIPYIMLVYEKPYDALGQLRRENNASTNTTSAWNYDTLGNIESVITYDYTTGDLGNLKTGIDYQYTDDGKSGWNRLLTTLVYKTYTYDEEGNRTTTVNDTKTITYDNIGNPVNYLGANLTWRGRQLKKYVDGSLTVSYLYDADGLRGSKTVNGVKSTYTYVGDKLVYESRSDGKEFYFFYDSYNNLTAIRYISGSTDNYYYVTTNLQGDVLGIYTGGGVLLASYEYDAWGNCTVTSHNANFTIGEDNPIRYRGYYYDSETGLYYLQSRYYDPEIGRFINADSQLNDNILGLNVFSYCINNPIMFVDSTGHAWYHWAIGAGIVAGLAVATVISAGTLTFGLTALGFATMGVTVGGTTGVLAMATVGSATVLGLTALGSVLNSTSIDDFAEQGDWGTVGAVVSGGVLSGISGYVPTPKPNTPEHTVGVGSPNNNVNPNGSYTKLDNKGNIYSYTQFDSLGRQSMRFDFQGKPHNGTLPHIHIYLYPEQGGRAEYVFDFNWHLVN